MLVLVILVVVGFRVEFEGVQKEVKLGRKG